MSKKNGKGYKKAIFSSAAAIILFTVLTGIFLQHTKVRENKNKAFYVSQAITGSVSSDFSSYFELLDFLEKLIQNDTVPYSVYLEYELQDLSGYKKALEYLLIGNHEGLSYSWSSSEGRSISDAGSLISFLSMNDLDEARNTGKTILSRQFEYKGKAYLALIKPVYVENKSGIKDFYCYCCAFLNADNIFIRTDFDNLSNAGYSYSLKLLEADGNEREIKKGGKLNEAISFHADFEASDLKLRLYLYPSAGWSSLYETFAQLSLAFIAAILLSFVIALIFYLSQKERLLSRYSYLDSLTSLYNSRKYFEDLKYIHKKQLPYGILYLDLNDFKPVNDTYGHLTGNELLKIIGKKLSNAIRETDTAYRIGGDEFSIIVKGSFDSEHYSLMASRIRQIIETKVIIQDLEIKVGVSIGFASFPEDGEDSEKVIKKAEEMMYAEKKARKAGR